MAGGYGTVNPGAVAGCGAAPVPAPGPFGGFGGLFGGFSWIWIILLLIFVLPYFGCGGLGGFFGGFSWIWILLLIVFLVPGILPGFRLGGFAV